MKNRNSERKNGPESRPAGKHSRDSYTLTPSERREVLQDGLSAWFFYKFASEGLKTFQADFLEAWTMDLEEAVQTIIESSELEVEKLDEGIVKKQVQKVRRLWT